MTREFIVVRKTFVVSSLLAAFAIPALSLAQQPAAPAETKDDGLKLGIFDVSGYADISYNHLSRSNTFTSTIPSRVFDLEKNGVAVRQLALTLASQPKEGLGGLVNI